MSQLRDFDARRVVVVIAIDPAPISILTGWILVTVAFLGPAWISWRRSEEGLVTPRRVISMALWGAFGIGLVDHDQTISTMVLLWGVLSLVSIEIYDRVRREVSK